MAKTTTAYIIVGEPRLVMTKTEKAGTIKTLDAILGVFGPKGEHWIKNEYESLDDGGITRACLVGAARIADGAYEAAAYAVLAMAVDRKAVAESYMENGGYFEEEGADNLITHFNDAPKTTFKDVKALVAKAKKMVRAAEEPKKAKAKTRR